MSDITRFEIKKLHGNLNFDLKFKDNKLILVGENGTGKSTVLKMLYYVMSRQWRKLLNFNFESVSITIDKQKFVLNYEDLRFSNDINLRNLPLQLRHEIRRMKHDDGVVELRKIEFLCKSYGINPRRVMDMIQFGDEEYQYSNEGLFSKNDAENRENGSKLLSLSNNIKEALSSTHIIYLPTYRRIEKELEEIFEGQSLSDGRSRSMMSQENGSDFIELVEFGMKGVDKIINKVLDSLKDFSRKSLNELTLGYLGEVVNKKYEKVDVSQIKEVSPEVIYSIISRIDDSILAKNSKKMLTQTLNKVKEGEKLAEHDRIVCHYFTNLLKSHQDLLNKELNIKLFCDVCNKYMVNKETTYDSSTFTFKISQDHSGEKQKIELNQLSSGEKQIVSLFSYLYLSDKTNFFVLIDEPELSLSVKWQKQFIVDIVNGEFCSGVVAVTHSPFIFDNELDPFARGLGEFTKLSK